MDRYVVVGLNHKSAPVELRERCAIEDAGAAIAELKELAREVAILSTCNRVEIYAHGASEPDRFVEWLAARSGCPAQDLRDHGYVRTGRNACKHLFFVAASLDSLVVGETQIRRQVRAAYDAAIAAGAVGPMLHGLFQAALRVSKEISEGTGIGRGNVSVAGAAADLAARVFDDLAGASVLVVGAGETAELLMTHLGSRGVQRFFVANRTPAHAEELAARFGAEGGGLDDLEERLAEADVVVAAAAGDTPAVTVGLARSALRRRRGRPIVVIDIAVPRAVDPRVDVLDNVYRYDMEALTAVTQDALRHRRKEFLQCCTLVDGAALRLAEETRSRDAGQVIAELERLYRTIAEEELEALEPKLDEAGRRQVRRTVHRIVRKLLHMPTRALREADPDESEAIRRAFAARRKK